MIEITRIVLRKWEGARVGVGFEGNDGSGSLYLEGIGMIRLGMGAIGDGDVSLPRGQGDGGIEIQTQSRGGLRFRGGILSAVARGVQGWGDDDL